MRLQHDRRMPMGLPTSGRVLDAPNIVTVSVGDIGRTSPVRSILIPVVPGHPIPLLRTMTGIIRFTAIDSGSS